MKKNRIIQQKKKEQEKIGNQEKERKYKVYKTRRRRIDKDNKEKQDLRYKVEEIIN